MDELKQQLENEIESNPVEAAQELPEGSDIKQEAIQAIDGGADAEVNNDVLDAYINEQIGMLGKKSKRTRKQAKAYKQAAEDWIRNQEYEDSWQMKGDMSDENPDNLPDTYKLPGEYIGSEVQGGDDEQIDYEEYPRLDPIEQEKDLIPYEGNEVAPYDDNLVDVTYSVSDDEPEENNESKNKFKKPKLPKIPDNKSGSGPSYLGQQSISDYVPESNDSSGAGGSFGSVLHSNIGASSFSSNVGNVVNKEDKFNNVSTAKAAPQLAQGKTTDASPAKAPTARPTSESSGSMMKNGAINSGSVNHTGNSLVKVNKTSLPSGEGHTQSYSDVSISAGKNSKNQMSEVLVMLINQELDAMKPNEYPKDIAETNSGYALDGTQIEDLGPADLNYVAKELGLN